MRSPRVVVLAAILTMGVAPTAAAEIPTAKKGTAIVLGQSIGKAKLGQTAKAGLKAWDIRDIKDCPPNGCTFGSSRKDEGPELLAFEGFGAFYFREGKIIAQLAIGLASKTEEGDPETRSLLTKFKTNKKIGLGSSAKQLLKAYPKGTRTTGADQALSRLRVKGPGKALTDFELRRGLVATIRISNSAASAGLR